MLKQNETNSFNKLIFVQLAGKTSVILSLDYQSSLSKEKFILLYICEFAFKCICSLNLKRKNFFFCFEMWMAHSVFVYVCIYINIVHIRSVHDSVYIGQFHRKLSLIVYIQEDLKRHCFIFKGFLTAMRQEVTRAHKGWALDSVTLHNDVIKAFKEDITSAPPVSQPTSHYILFLCIYDILMS